MPGDGTRVKANRFANNKSRRVHPVQRPFIIFIYTSPSLNNKAYRCSRFLSPVHLLFVHVCSVLLVLFPFTTPFLCLPTTFTFGTKVFSESFIHTPSTTSSLNSTNLCGSQKIFPVLDIKYLPSHQFICIFHFHQTQPRSRLRFSKASLDNKFALPPDTLSSIS